ncbi:hypothetical protein [uncultured Dysosmobacter sp.]|uniref:hypothetical protein n=1 Tax=uncultured Dysosmobacter sp. TaxID=2591384 RepID=UPI00262926DD|nr:hypothetical protein [uncultured Dysosmobacter sp.]
MDFHNERQMQALEAAVERQSTQAKVSASRHPQEPLCGALMEAQGPRARLEMARPT